MKTSTKDLQQVFKLETGGGKISRKFKTTTDKTTGKKTASNLVYVCDAERKSAFIRLIVSLRRTIENAKQEKPSETALIENWTNGLRLLLVSENETENKCKQHITIGRKTFGVLEYYPTTVEQLIEVVSAARLALKEYRIAQQEKERETARAERAVSLAESLTIEQLQAIIAAKQASK